MEPSEPTNQVNQTPTPVEPVKVKRKRPIAWVLLSLLLLAVSVALGYFLYMSTIDSTKKDEQLTASQAKVSDLEERLGDTANESEEADSTTAELSDQEQIIEVASAYSRAETGSQNATVNVNVDKLEGNFARASVNIAGSISGQSCIFKQTDDMWLRLYCAQGESEETQRLDTLYGVPKSIIQS